MMRGSPLNCVRFVRTSIRPMTNNTLQHSLSQMFFRCCSGTPLKRSALGQKKLAVLTRVFFTRKCMAAFVRQPKKVAVMTRWPYYGEVAEMRGSTVTINSRANLAHCRLWAVSLFLRAFRSCSKWIVAIILLPYKLLINNLNWNSQSSKVLENDVLSGESI